MSCYCDYDPADIWHEDRRTSRKHYTCYECREEIEPGDDYMRLSYLLEGKWGHCKLCDCCDWSWEYLKDQGVCQLVGGLDEAWEEYWRDT